MTTIELEQIIEAQAESQNLDFKQDCAWNVKTMVKDILAMSNVRDGGTIVIGVREDDLSFIGEGVSDENIKSYNIDVMKDQLLKYVDPYVNIKVDCPSDSKGNKYVVIKIFSFKETPVFSKTDIEGELKANMLYYRNTNRRVESAPISNATDFRDIIEVAAVKLMQRRKDFGFSVETEEAQLLDKEISNIPISETLKKIKSKGYWEIRFQPLNKGNIESLNDCLKLVEKSQVRLDWSLPWIPRRNDGIERMYPSDNCYEAQSEWGARKEFWRMYQSEQFLMYNSLTEDWYAEDNLRKELAAKYPSGKFVTLNTSIIHLITQTIAFLGRLGSHGLYKNGVKIIMVLHNTRERQLMINPYGRLPFIEPKITLATNVKLEEEYSIEKVIQENTLISNKLILKVLDKFGFNPLPETILNDQTKFLNGLA